jgi:hypothetical protein
VEATSDPPTTIKAALTRPNGSLWIRSKPPGATIKINGRRVGKTDRTVSVPAFEPVKVTVTSPGAPPQTKKVKAKPGKKQEVRFTFTKPKKKSTKKKSTKKKSTKKKSSSTRKKSSKRRR